MQTLGSFKSADPRKFATQTRPRLYITEMTDEEAQRMLDAALLLVKRWKGTLGL